MNTKKKDYKVHLCEMEYMHALAQVSLFMTHLDYLRIVDNLDIDYDSYTKEFKTIKREILELEDKDIITGELYLSLANKLQDIGKRLRDEYNSVRIVELYLKRINEVSLDEMEEIVEKLTEYVEDLRLFNEEEYQKVYKKYGLLEKQTLIKYLELANKSSSK